MQDYAGRLPLHYACMYGAPKSVAKALLKAHPQGAQARAARGLDDGKGELPIDCARRNEETVGRELEASVGLARRAASRAAAVPGPRTPASDSRVL